MTERNADVSKTLTEQWKKGELKQGWYYVQLQEGVYADNVKSIIMDYYTEFCDFMKHPYLIELVLAPVPSYDEWQQVQEQINKNGWWYSEKAYKELKKENTKLKELLEKWLPEFDCYHDTLTSQFCKEARQVLGEE